MTEMSSVTLVLQPQRDILVPAWLGRAAQANFLRALETVHPVFSRAIHDAPGARQFTSSSLIGARKQGDQAYLRQGDTLRLRYTTLHPHLTALFHAHILPQWSERGICLHGHRVPVVKLQTRGGWNDQIDYVQLVDDALAHDLITLLFTSPTAFKRTGGFITPLPQPELVFGSLFNRWNAFAPFRLPDWLYDTAHADVVIDQIQIQTETITFAGGRKGVVPGFTGRVTYRLLCSEEARRYLHALAGFAKYGGVGIKTTVGMGQVHLKA